MSYFSQPTAENIDSTARRSWPGVTRPLFSLLGKGEASFEHAWSATCALIRNRFCLHPLNQ